MQGEDDLLVFFLHRDKAHVGSANGFTDGRRVGRIIFAAFAGEPVRSDELGGDQFDGMAVGAELSCPVMRAGAGFEADQTRRQFRNEQ